MTSKVPVNNVYIPNIDFPEYFVKTSEVEILPYGEDQVLLKWKYENKEVVLPTWFWEDSVSYVIDVDNARKDFNIIR